MSAILRQLRQVELLADLTGKEMEVIASHSELRRFEEGEIIFDQTTGNGKLYVMEEGEVLISKLLDGDRQMSLATFVEGETFGELSLFDETPGRTIARAESDVRLLVFPAGRRHAQAAIADHPVIAAKILHSLLVTVAGRIRRTNRLVAERTPWVQELRRQVLVDKLTGLYNNSYLEEEFRKQFDAAPSAVGILVLKPDNFKAINDTYGHDTGDKVLHRMARAVEAQIQGTEVAVRYQGNVLVVILPGADLPTARRRAAVLRGSMSGLDLGDVIPGASASADALRGVPVSIGVAVYPTGGSSAGDLVEKASQNMFAARNRGGNRLCCAQKSTPRVR